MGFSQVGVEKISLNGRVRMTLKPLMDEMPIVAAIQVCQLTTCLVLLTLVFDLMFDLNPSTLSPKP